jgi:hypothetical protein
VSKRYSLRPADGRRQPEPQPQTPTPTPTARAGGNVEWQAGRRLDPSSSLPSASRLACAFPSPKLIHMSTGSMPYLHVCHLMAYLGTRGTDGHHFRAQKRFPSLRVEADVAPLTTVYCTVCKALEAARQQGRTPFAVASASRRRTEVKIRKSKTETSEETSA